MVLFAYRTARHESTGESLFSLIYGREAIFPSELSTKAWRGDSKTPKEYKRELVIELAKSIDIVRTGIIKKGNTYKAQYDKTRKDNKFHVGELVYLERPQKKSGKNRKLTPHYEGPFKINQQLGKVNYEIQRVDGDLTIMRVHVQRLKKGYVVREELNEAKKPGTKKEKG